MNIADIEWERWEKKGKREQHGKEVSRDFLSEYSRKEIELKFRMRKLKKQY